MYNYYNYDTSIYTGPSIHLGPTYIFIYYIKELLRWPASQQNVSKCLQTSRSRHFKTFTPYMLHQSLIPNVLSAITRGDSSSSSSVRQGWKRLCLFSSFAFWQRIRTQLIRNALWPTHVCHKEEYAPRVFFFCQ